MLSNPPMQPPFASVTPLAYASDAPDRRFAADAPRLIGNPLNETASR